MTTQASVEHLLPGVTDIGVLEAIERRVLWLAVRMIDRNDLRALPRIPPRSWCDRKRGALGPRLLIPAQLMRNHMYLVTLGSSWKGRRWADRKFR